MTPMIDIVFLLIVFFMTVAQVTRVIDHPVALPNVAAGAETGKSTSVTLNVANDGKLIVAGKVYSMKRVANILQSRVNPSHGQTDHIEIEIRCDRQCSSDHVNRIIGKLADLGFQYVKIAVNENN